MTFYENEQSQEGLCQQRWKCIKETKSGKTISGIQVGQWIINVIADHGSADMVTLEKFQLYI
jgi:hypothetical protein